MLSFDYKFEGTRAEAIAVCRKEAFAGIFSIGVTFTILLYSAKS